MNLAQFDTSKKLRNLILLLAKDAEENGDEFFGRTKLNKLLFYIDFTAHARLGYSVTGKKYQKLPHGPALRAMKPVLDEMEHAGQIVTEARGFDYVRQVPLAHVEPENSVFAYEELEIIRGVIERFRGVSGTRASEQCYSDYPVAMFEEGEEIPYSLAIVGNDAATEDEIVAGTALEASILATDDPRDDF